jgi:hypothetical protein
VAGIPTNIQNEPSFSVQIQWAKGSVFRKPECLPVAFTFNFGSRSIHFLFYLVAGNGYMAAVSVLQGRQTTSRQKIISTVTCQSSRQVAVLQLPVSKIGIFFLF